jgi:hypothetical protein
VQARPHAITVSRPGTDAVRLPRSPDRAVSRLRIDAVWLPPSPGRVFMLAAFGRRRQRAGLRAGDGSLHEPLLLGGCDRPWLDEAYLAGSGSSQSKKEM